MKYSYADAVRYLEALQIMPKTMPGLDKIKRALAETSWFSEIDPNKVIVVAGTNGKGSTSAALEALLLEARQRVGFYSSPHLVSTTERIRTLGKDISENSFVALFESNLELIRKCELTHFEALTLMAGDYFFNKKWEQNLDFIILEVGLGGTFDATNAFPHKYNIITKLGLDHVNILGNNLQQIAANKFGVVGRKSIVVHHPLDSSLHDLKMQVQRETNSNWIEANKPEFVVKHGTSTPEYLFKYDGLSVPLSLPGFRFAENVMSAIAMLQVLGFDFASCAAGLKKIRWNGRMQKLELKSVPCPVYLSGDHNEQGIRSLLQILQDFRWKNLHLMIGIGNDKDQHKMFDQLLQLENVKIYLTETPFKGRKIEDYDLRVRQIAQFASADPLEVLHQIGLKATPEDLCVVTGSLYLVGEILKTTSS